jgi:hypothetical protein
MKWLLYVILSLGLWVSCTQQASQKVIPANAYLYYTKHAQCRMDCRHITEHEIREVLERGVVNGLKSNPNDQPCPTYAIESRTEEGQQLRIVFAKCSDEVKVITCIDLEHDFECDCY